MAKRTPTYYEILGVKPNAKHNDIGLAHNRLAAARRKENAPPDLKGEARQREAFEVLSDLDRRAAYDRQLAAAQLKPSFGATQGALAGIVIAAFAAGIYYYTVKRPADEAARPVGRSSAEIAAAATPAIGRLLSIDMSGQSRPLGLALAIDAGVMVASCHGIAPGALLAVNLNPRQVSARVAMADEVLGLCKLEVEGAGSWPLSVSSTEARVGDVVYGASVNAVGEVVLKEGRVMRVVEPAPRGKVIEATVPPNPQMPGAPLLDTFGRVVAVATQAGGQGRYVVIPAGWTDAPRTAGTPVAAPPPASPVAQPAPPMPNMPGAIAPEREDRLEKAFRPPPKVPDDL